ncbi:MAG: histidinol dehydrogenase [Azospirillaceae bacterium]
MPVRLRAGSPGFEAAFEAFLARNREDEGDVREAVADIIAAVRREGDAALHSLTRRFDRVDLAMRGSRLDAGAVRDHAARTEPAVREALEVAAERIRAFHARQTEMLVAQQYTDADGVRLGARFTPLDAVGLYVPGGRAAYPSSVLMNAVPAKVAGVGRLVMAVPTPDGVVNAAVMAAAEIAGVDEVHTIGGAQAVAALAYGTGTIRPVDKIVGPGNAYVAEAKRQVFGHVGIDSIAGPSEILVVADADNDPRQIAIDLLSQAEHDSAAQAVLISDDEDFADAVAAAVDDWLGRLRRREIAAASWRDNGAIITVPSLADAPALVDRLAPEHLELALTDADGFMGRVRHAGAVFLGRHTPEAIGDYVAGPNHVLPTSRSARFSSGLNLLDFVKRTTFVACDAESLRRIGPYAVTLADAEGLEAHGLSVSVRLGADGGLDG